MQYLLLICLLIVSTILKAEQIVKIACIGNSITYGAGISNREKNSYPAQLQYYLGEGYDIRNFGSNGATVLTKGDSPFIKTNAYQESKEFLPDIVLIKLGTNDTKPHNWKYKDQFADDYQALINTYRSLPSHPKIILMTPVRCFLTEQNTINPDVIENEIRPTIEQLAYKNGIGIINLFNLFGNQWNWAWMPDRLHPSSIGAGMMAQKIGDYILQTTQSSQATFIPKNASPFNFHGYQGYDFQIDGIPCKIVRPMKEAKGRPWVWRARFWGHEPQTDVDLLEHGFHIAYCDVTDLYGANKAVTRWNKFYKFMKRNGFNPKVALEGMSRGGLIVYNWAAQNTDKVACIYADAPVMDIKSWPMGEGAYTGSQTDVSQLLKAYGFKSIEEAKEWKGNPIDHAERISQAGIPILHVVGDADNIVPIAENTTLFETEMQRRNTPIKVIHKPEVGHHPHSLNNPAPIVQFILKATGYSSNPCTHAVPGNEYRSAAGWTEGSEWHSVAQDIETTLEGRKVKLLLLGNSITQGWGGTRKRVTHKPGKAAIDKVLGEANWESAGISGDRTQNLLWRIRYGNYNRCHPQYVAIAIGINNLIGGSDDADDTADGIIAVTEEACRQFPNSKIILLGLFPSGKEKNSAIRKQCDRIHELLRTHAFDKRVNYVNPTGWFLNEQGSIRDGLYAGDYIHLTTKGYECVATQLKNLIKPIEVESQEVSNNKGKTKIL